MSLDPLLLARLQGDRPVFLLIERDGETPTAFVLWVDGRAVTLPPTAAPHLANVWSSLTVYAFDAHPLQYFWTRARILPKAYVNASLLLRFYAETGIERLPLMEHGDPLRAASVLYERCMTGPMQRYAPYLQQWLDAHTLLDLHSADGYVLSEATVHPVWTVPVVPGRITTRNPPLHGLPGTSRDGWRARLGKRWVHVTWPNVASRIAQMVLHAPADPLPEGADWMLGAHGVLQPEAYTEADLFRLRDLGEQWRRTAADKPYPLPVPWPVSLEPASVGKLALGATGAFTVSQLAVLFRARQRRELLGLSDVVPYLGSLAFQVDDRIPLPALHHHLRTLHGFHVSPVARVGIIRGQMYPLDGPLTPVALDLDKPMQFPVVCPVCGGRADCERDLQQHYVEDHPQEVRS